MKGDARATINFDKTLLISGIYYYLNSLLDK